MARQKHVEPLTRGLWTSRDPAHLPPGALVKAKNLRYQPGDVAIFQAEGRTALGAISANSKYFTPLVWDPLTYRVKGAAEPYQILYVDASPGDDYQLATAEVGPTGVVGTSTLHAPTTLSDLLGFKSLVGINAIDRANGDLANWFILSGRSFAIIRGAAPDTTVERYVTHGTGAMVVWYTTGGGVTWNRWYYIADPRNPEDYPQIPLLSAVDDTIVFALQQKWDRLLIQGSTTTSVIPGAVWEFFNVDSRAWETLTTLDGTGTLAQGGTVSWVGDDYTYGAAPASAITSSLPEQVDGNWYWVRLRRTGAGSGRRFLTREPIGGWTETTSENTKDQRIIRHGMPESSGVGASVVAAAGGTVLAANQRYWYWWVWADKPNSHEGTASQRVSALTTSSNRTFQLTLNFGATTIPWGVTHAYIYRGTSVDGADGQKFDPYPTGQRVFELPIQAIDGDSTKSWTFTDNGTQVSSTLPSPYNTAQQFDDYGQDFPSVTLTDPASGQPSITIARDGAPPRATTGDIFQGCLVTNDITDPRKVRFSFPERPHSFPDLYYFNLDTPENDRVIAIRSLGKVAGVLTTRQLWRLNWLPQNTDQVFQRAEAMSKVLSSFGAISNDGVCSFTMPGVGEMIAWVGPGGVYASDLYDWRELSLQLDWSTVRSGSKILIDNPTAYRLEMYVLGVSDAEVWYFHYHPTLVEDGILPITGPMERPNGADHATGVWVSDDTFWPVSGRGATLYQEAAGDTDGGRALGAEMKTRELYLQGLGEEFKVLRSMLHVKDAWVTNPIVLAVSSTDSKPKALKFIRTGSRRLEAPWTLNKAEFVQFTVGGRIDENAGLSVTTIGLDYEPLGKRETT